MLELRKPGVKDADFLKTPKIDRLVPRNATGRSEEQIIKERQRADRELEKISDLYVEAQGNKETLTLANDLLLRLFLRLDLGVDATGVFFADLGKRISEKDAAKNNTGDEQREKERAENIQKSIFQLAPFIRSELARNPDLVFASSPELDEKRGVDLIRCQPTWDPEEQKLILDIQLIQAKSGITDVDEIRRLGRVYRSTMRQIQKEFALSEFWFKDLARGVSAPEDERPLEVLIDHLAAKKALVELLEVPPENQKLASLREYHRALEVFGQMAKIIEAFGEEQIYPAPKIELRKFNFFILIETNNGPKYLSAEEAANYSE